MAQEQNAVPVVQFQMLISTAIFAKDFCNKNSKNGISVFLFIEFIL
jgi:hypothetical protein